MTVALSEACIYAARASANLLEQLWMSGNISSFGYFDAHYTFSATVILMISEILRPNTEDRDAIALSLALLQSMVDDGNLPARELMDRMATLRKDLETLKTSRRFNKDSMTEPMKGYITSTGTFAANISRSRPFTPSRSQVTHDASESTPGTSSDCEVGSTSHPVAATAPLDAPFIQGFLGDCVADWSPQGFDFENDEDGVWASAWDSLDFRQADGGFAF